MKYRRAVPEDAQGVYAVAHAVSRAAMESAGADERKLVEQGFLLYPLEAADQNAPNYKERIEASSHFWVAEEAGRVVGFLMAYTFETMEAFAQKTPNDLETLDYFLNRMRIRGSAIYLAQTAVDPKSRGRRIGTNLVREAFRDIDGAEHPGVVGEIAQHPLFNAASSASALRNGHVPLFLREKDSANSPHHGRLSATFVHTFPFRDPSGLKPFTR